MKKFECNSTCPKCTYPITYRRGTRAYSNGVRKVTIYCPNCMKYSEVEGIRIVI